MTFWRTAYRNGKLILIILLVFTRTVYFPLKKITAGAMEYADGNLDHTIKVKTNDEMGYLADTLNYMSSERMLSSRSSRMGR